MDARDHIHVTVYVIWIKNNNAQSECARKTNLRPTEINSNEHTIVRTSPFE